jgi:hypothetical protein
MAIAAVIGVRTVALLLDPFKEARARVEPTDQDKANATTAHHQVPSILESDDRLTALDNRHRADPAPTDGSLHPPCEGRGRPLQDRRGYSERRSTRAPGPLRRGSTWRVW